MAMGALAGEFTRPVAPQRNIRGAPRNPPRIPPEHDAVVQLLLAHGAEPAAVVTAAPEKEPELAPQEQRWPPSESDGFIADAVSEECQDRAIELFRQYFSADCYFLLPLLVHAQAARGLDFSDCRTTVIFSENKAPRSGSAMLSSELVTETLICKDNLAGAVTWRLREPSLPAGAAAAGRVLDSGEGPHRPPSTVLEILFLAVDERHRHKNYGRRLRE